MQRRPPPETWDEFLVRLGFASETGRSQEKNRKTREQHLRQLVETIGAVSDQYLRHLEEMEAVHRYRVNLAGLLQDADRAAAAGLEVARDQRNSRVAGEFAHWQDTLRNLQDELTRSIALREGLIQYVRGGERKKRVFARTLRGDLTAIFADAFVRERSKRPLVDGATLAYALGLPLTGLPSPDVKNASYPARASVAARNAYKERLTHALCSYPDLSTVVGPVRVKTGDLAVTVSLRSGLAGQIRPVPGEKLRSFQWKVTDGRSEGS
jgi:hypothetical protein